MTAITHSPFEFARFQLDNGNVSARFPLDTAIRLAPLSEHFRRALQTGTVPLYLPDTGLPHSLGALPLHHMQLTAYLNLWISEDPPAWPSDKDGSPLRVISHRLDAEWERVTDPLTARRLHLYMDHVAGDVSAHALRRVADLLCLANWLGLQHLVCLCSTWLACHTFAKTAHELVHDINPNLDWQDVLEQDQHANPHLYPSPSSSLIP